MDKFKSLWLKAGLTVTGLALSASQTYAAVNGNSGIPVNGTADFTTPKDGTTQFLKIANTVISTLLLVAGVLAIFYLIWAGIQYITSAGSPDKAKAARGGIINAIIGIVIIVAAYFIIKFAVGLGTTASS